MPSTVQHTAVRLMLNLVEVLVARSKATADRAAIEQHRQLLQQMLVTHLAKLSTLERQVPKLMAAGACSACALCANTLNSIFQSCWQWVVPLSQVGKLSLATLVATPMWSAICMHFEQRGSSVQPLQQTTFIQKMPTYNDISYTSLA